MSDIVLTQIIERHCDDIIPKMIDQYNNPELTKAGQLEVLRDTIRECIYKGKLIQEKIYERDNKDLKNQINKLTIELDKLKNKTVPPPKEDNAFNHAISRDEWP
jgi:hypothetical protein